MTSAHQSPHIDSTPQQDPRPTQTKQAGTRVRKIEQKTFLDSVR